MCVEGVILCWICFLLPQLINDDISVDNLVIQTEIIIIHWHKPFRICLNSF